MKVFLPSFLEKSRRDTLTSIIWLHFRAFLSSSSEFELRLEKEYRASSLNRAIIKIARASRVRVRAAARYVPIEHHGTRRPGLESVQWGTTATKLFSLQFITITILNHKN